jgi:hypothetical protein
MATISKRRRNEASILASFLNRRETNRLIPELVKIEANSIYSTNSKDRSGANSVYSTNWKDQSEAKSVYSSNSKFENNSFSSIVFASLRKIICVLSEVFASRLK